MRKHGEMNMLIILIVAKVSWIFTMSKLINCTIKIRII